MGQPHDARLEGQLILDELFDLSLYQALRDLSEGDTRKVLDDLIDIEKTHFAFWQEFFHLNLTTLDPPRRLKLRLIVLTCRLFGSPAVHLVLDAIEVYGVRKYLTIWKRYQDSPLGAAVKGILVDELKHEDTVVTSLTERHINPERIRNIFLGVNDGLVEIVGAVSGFFAAFGESATVLIAAFTTAVAGSLSMGAGVYVAVGSEKEVERTERGKQEFLGTSSAALPEDRPLASALIVGGSYFAGAMVPVLPVLFGATDARFSLLTAGSMVVLVSMVLAFLSGMDIKKRILTNLIILTCAVAITYAIGLTARSIWGISV